MKDVLCWCRASKQEALGHFVRIKLFYEFLKSKSFNVQLLIEVDNFTKKTIKSLVNHNEDITFVPLNSTKVLKNKNYDVIIVDRFVYSLEYVKKILISSKKLFIFNEINQFRNFGLLRENDIIISSQLTNKKVVKNNKFVYLSGLNYFVINKSNVQLINKIKKFDIVIMLGGGYGYDAYLKKLINLISHFSHKSIKILVGPKPLINTLKYIEKSLSNYEIIKFCKYPQIYLERAKIGIIGGGYAKYEAAFYGLPSIICPVQSHQKTISKIFCNKNGGIYFDLNRDSKKKFNQIIENLFFDKIHYLKLKKNQRKIIDGKAIDRIYKFI